MDDGACRRTGAKAFIAMAMAVVALLLVSPPALALPPPLDVVPLYGQGAERQLRDSRVCEVWATRKSAAASDSGFVDVAAGSVRGLFDGMAFGSYFGSMHTAAIVGLGVGGGVGAWQAMTKQKLRAAVYAECMIARGYGVR